ncbi:MAG: hypothetical protein KA714_13325 [Limnoraphis sp. WC205]|nr:hypothetical protein [Limnoraphis sp. WC205]
MGIPTYLSVGIERLYANKTNYAEHYGQPKLAIISGYNAFYGIRCQSFQTEIGLGCLNGGTHMGLGIDYLLYRGKKWLRPGDIVLLSLEYSHYISDGIPSDTLIDYVVAFDRQYLDSLNWMSKVKFVMSVPIGRIIEGIKNRLAHIDFHQSYQYEQSFFEGLNGDNDHLYEVEQTPQMKAFITQITASKDLQGWVSQTSGLKSIDTFVKWCHQKNILVLATWPNTIWFDAYNDPKTEQFFTSIIQFYQALNVPILGQPQDFMYDQSLFYDNNYHLNRQGIEIRTQKTIDFFKEF